jgi:tetratricopeptide (TPR) repeat protein
MGYGVKRDYPGQRDLDLDRTYENLVRPAAEAAGLRCLRGDEITVGTVIDRGLFDALLRAAVVVADLSTANPNALYELGLRHAFRPRSTILIAERELRLPFDLNHLGVLRYEHLGKDIGVSEARRFTAELAATMRDAAARFEPDSPVYVHLPDLVPPVSPAALSLVGPESAQGPSLHDLVRTGEVALAHDDLEKALELFAQALAVDPFDPDLIRRVVEARLHAYNARGLPEHVDAARALLRQALQDAPGEPALLALWAEIHERVADATGAAEAIDHALRARERLAAITDTPTASLAYARILDRHAELRPERRELDRMLAEEQRLRVVELSTDPSERAEALAGLDREADAR